MSFDGDLEHLPLVDVIQLLHATGKSGTLTLRGAKGESQLVFHGGYIVSANHVDNSVRIGKVLIDKGLISEEDLTAALRDQQKAGATRKPIIQTMIESGRIGTEEAYQGLETLIEMTIVEILTWTRGTFSLDVNKIFVSDEYRYFPEQLKQDIQINTQSVLMDALRIYDERKRDGTLTPGSVFGAPPPAESTESKVELSAADLGLDELDNLERKIPQSFTGLTDQEPDTPASRLKLLLSGVPADEQQQLIRFVEDAAGRSQEGADGTGVILFTADKLLRECIASVCGPRFLFATNDAAGLDPVIDHSLSKGRVPLLLVDPGEPSSRGGKGEGAAALVSQKRARYGDLRIIVLACPGDYQLSTAALQSGASAVLPRPSREERAASFTADTIASLEILERNLPQAPSQQAPQGILQQLKDQLVALSEQREPSEVTFALLQAVASFFQRGVTLVAVRSELIAERGFGITAPGATSTVKLRTAIPEDSLFQKALQGESYYGDADSLVRDTIFQAIGTPASQKVLLLPVKSFGRVIAVVYGDFGNRAGGAPQPELLDMLALHAGLVIDNGLYRKRCAQK